jgi:hypothetical protein
VLGDAEVNSSGRRIWVRLLYFAQLTVACISYDFVEFLLMELEEDYDENLDMCLCRLFHAIFRELANGSLH